MTRSRSSNRGWSQQNPFGRPRQNHPHRFHAKNRRTWLSRIARCDPQIPHRCSRRLSASPNRRRAATPARGPHRCLKKQPPKPSRHSAAPWTKQRSPSIRRSRLGKSMNSSIVGSCLALPGHQRTNPSRRPRRHPPWPGDRHWQPWR